MPRARWRCRVDACTLLAMAALLACAPPVTARLDDEIEKGIGHWMAQAFIAQRGRLDQPPIEQWISDLGEELLAHSSRPGLDHHFVVLDSPEVNGFALPGGWVFVTAGLLETMETEDELAAVIAHEIGHIANRDFQRIMLRTALWLGLTQVLRDNDRHDWVPLAQGAQLVETLSHSRSRESEADAAGARIAWEAGYDPRAMATFLGDEPNWSYLQTVFATHPHPDKRTRRLDEHFASFRAEDPQGALALARSLLDRGRRATAREVLAEPLSDVCEVERGVLLARAREAQQAASPAGATRLPANAHTEVGASLTALREARDSAKDPRDLAWRRLKRLWKDEQIGRALVVAQAVDPELTDAGYLLTLAQSINVLHRAIRGANLLARTLHLRASTADGTNALGTGAPRARVDDASLPALTATAGEVVAIADARSSRDTSEAREIARLAGEYHECARLVAPLLVELALAGNGDPAGSLVFSRFLLIETRVRLLEKRVGHLDDASDRLAEQAWRDAVAVYRLRLNLMALEADEASRAAIVATLERRVGGDRAERAETLPDDVLAGDRAVETLRSRMQTRGDRFGDDLRAIHILMRIAFHEVKEQLTPSAKGDTARKGAETSALRGAVGYPQ